MTPAIYAVITITGIAALAGLGGYHYGMHKGLSKTGDWDLGFDMGVILGRYGSQLRIESDLTGIPIDELILRQSQYDKERERWDD